MNEVIEQLIKEHVPSVETTTQRNMDSLDFHDVHITSLVDLVKAAIEIGTNIGIGINVNDR